MDTTVLAREMDALGRGCLCPREFVHQATTLIARRVEYDNVCFVGLDPSSLLPAWAVRRCRLPSSLVPRLVEIEVGEMRHARLAETTNRPAEKTLLLSEETDGALDRSPRYRDILRPLELKHQIRTMLRAQGMTWGFIGLHRGARKPDFDPDEVALLEQVATPFAVGLRRSLVRGMTEGGILDDSPAVLVLSADLRVVSCTDAAQALLLDLEDPVLHDPEGLPLCVRSVGLRVVHPDDPTGRATTRVRSCKGQWLTIRAAALDGGGRVAVVIERTPRSDVVSLVLAAHGLTTRESEVAGHVLLGLSTQDVSEVLGISEYTVQDHMKSIFDKTGVSSRKELAARLFAQCAASRSPAAGDA
jgi:DNA-binding CsgD family transcriptional regulator